MKCHNLDCVHCIANSCTNSKVFLEPNICRLNQISFQCLECKKTKSERCVNCTKEFK